MGNGTGACIALEHWEEGFPRSWDEPGMNPGAHHYHQPLLPMYEEDTRAKFETIRDTLRDCDYLVLASNRLDWPDQLDPRVKSFLKINELIFKPYDAVDLQQILRIRADKAIAPRSRPLRGARYAPADYGW